MPKSRSKRPPAASRAKRKNMLLDQAKLDAARAALGLTTETETVNAALDLVVFRTEVFVALDHLVDAGGLAVPARSRRPA